MCATLCSLNRCILFSVFHVLPSGVINDDDDDIKIKNKSGNLSDIDNYRAIAISTAVSKVFESVILSLVLSDSEVDQYQFGFKKGHSTAHCADVLKQTTDYYTSRGSHVLLCFIDFTKAFDKVNYWKLFMKLLDDNINSSIVSLLACLLYTSPSPRDGLLSRMPSSA